MSEGVKIGSHIRAVARLLCNAVGTASISMTVQEAQHKGAECWERGTCRDVHLTFVVDQGCAYGLKLQVKQYLGSVM